MFYWHTPHITISVQSFLETIHILQYQLNLFLKHSTYYNISEIFPWHTPHIKISVKSLIDKFHILQYFYNVFLRHSTYYNVSEIFLDTLSIFYQCLFKHKLATSRQARKLKFGMQCYFNPTNYNYNNLCIRQEKFWAECL